MPYADDMNLLVSNKSLKKSIMVLNKELAHLEEWFQANKLTANLSKTKFILFGSRQKERLTNSTTNSTTTRLDQDLNLKLGRQIDRVAHTKFLGLVFILIQLVVKLQSRSEYYIEPDTT